jgi:predicted metal-dependent hydrolase
MPKPAIEIDQIIRTRRKTIALIVKRDATLIVRAPLHASDAQIMEIVRKKADWISKKKEWVQAHYPKTHQKEYVRGEKFWYLGNVYRVEIVEQARSLLGLEDKFLLASRAIPKARAVFEAWYREQARLVIEKRVELYARKIGLRYNRVKITSATTRWGSCSSRGNLNFAWRLVMAPLPVIDYVVVHELVHLQERRHSRAFWSKVKAIVPEYKERKKWLDRNGEELRL